MIKIPNQPIMARFGETVWLTDFITPNNPDIKLLVNKYIASTQEETMWNLWQYVANMPYNEVVASTLYAAGLKIAQSDTWFYPGETVQLGVGNCANKTFLLVSLLKNLGVDVHGVMGTWDDNNHAWIQVEREDTFYYIETTSPKTEMFMTLDKEGYDPFIYFDNQEVFATEDSKDFTKIFKGKFIQPGVVDWFNDYLSTRALDLVQ